MAQMQFPFTLTADAGTDLWKTPPSTDSNNDITFSTAYTTQFDQAGIVLTLTHAPTSTKKWIKAGVEFFDGQPRLSVVCCDNWADWSVAPIAAGSREAITKGKQSVAIRVERNETTLWIYHVDEQGTKVPLREIAWVYGHHGGEGWEVEVGALVARPNTDVKEPLEATFQALNVEWEKH